MNTDRLIKLADLNFTNRLNDHCPFLFVKVASTPLTNPMCLHVNTQLLRRLEMAPNEREKPSFLRFINGDLEFEGLFFGASVYSGHQFGYFSPRLGDGRALMLGEVKTSLGEFYELQLKGSGPTPFSRMGDGKAVVRSSIREYLASAHLWALGIPTTEALSIIHGSDEVRREEIEKSSIVLRVATSFLRFGHFQYFASQKQTQELKALVDFSINAYFEPFIDHPNCYVLFFQEIVKRTAKLFAAWQAVGFCHGVLNTDNTSLLGLTIDFGPFGFIEHFDPDHICNHSDHEGRYSFGNQPAIGLWNLEKLAEALQSLIPKNDLERTLETYAPLFQFEYLRLMREKLGLSMSQKEDDELIKHLQSLLMTTQIDYTQFFRALSYYQTTGELPFKASKELTFFLDIYQARINKESSKASERREKMLSVNPKFILRNYLAQLAFLNYEKNPIILDKLYNVLNSPFEEWEEFEEWSKPAPPEYQNFSVSCSS